jgi:hypothetical protein
VSSSASDPDPHMDPPSIGGWIRIQTEEMQGEMTSYDRQQGTIKVSKGVKLVLKC